MSNMMDMKDLMEQASPANRGNLFKLHIGGRSKRVRDKNAEEHLKQTLGDEGQIVSREMFKDKNSLVYQRQQLASEMYTYHTTHTLAFGNDSGRWLANAQIFTYTSTMSGYLSRLDQMKQQIIANWDALVQQDITARNAALALQNKPQTAKVEDYPTASKMEAMLYVEWYPEAVPTVGNFLVELPPELLQRAQEQYDTAVRIGAQDYMSRMLQPVAAFIGKLNEYKGEKGQRWHPSFVNNLNELATELTPLNITNDPQLTAFTDQIRAIVRPYVFAPDVLKESPEARDLVKAKLLALHQQMEGYKL